MQSMILTSFSPISTACAIASSMSGTCIHTTYQQQKQNKKTLKSLTEKTCVKENERLVIPPRAARFSLSPVVIHASLSI